MGRCVVPALSNKSYSHCTAGISTKKRHSERWGALTQAHGQLDHSEYAYMSKWAPTKKESGCFLWFLHKRIIVTKKTNAFWHLGLMCPAGSEITYVAPFSDAAAESLLRGIPRKALNFQNSPHKILPPRPRAPIFPLGT